ncbi:ricin-type beta-trefoil lectin domain protein [Micromonosporaceae bacterium B7E4]
MTSSAWSVRIRGARMRGCVAFVSVVVLALGLIMVMSTRSVAVDGERVTFVNGTGETLWIGSGESGDGSRRIGGLPTLSPGGSATIVIPDGDQPGHWRGRFFARQRCGGDPGSTFRCLVGDCGAYPDRCERGAEPVSLAEFNFDQNNPAAPWYNVSYVDALSLTITIDTPGAPRPGGAGSCVRWDCSGGQLLAACPEAHAVHDPQRGDRVNCVNPNRDAESAYTAALRPFGPRAYLWSTHDRVPGNETVFNCAGCADFVVTFRNGGAAVAPPAVGKTVGKTVIHAITAGSSVFALRGYADKCIDVPGGVSADGAQLQVWECNGSPAQQFSHGPNGSLVALDKCMDVAWAAQDNGAKVQLAYCNGGPAQVWVAEGGILRNPHSNKCVDVRDWNAANGAPLQIWRCAAGQANQAWRAVDR